MAFWSCAPEVLICSFLIYAKQTLTPGDKGQELLLVWCPKMIAQVKVRPWWNLKTLHSEPIGRNLLGFCPKIILRGVQVYNKRRRATVPCAGGGENINWSWGKFTKLSANLFFFFFSWILGVEGQHGSIIFQTAESLEEENITFYTPTDTGLCTIKNVTLKGNDVCFFKQK